eukprot:GHVU01013130.1.p1 GENE.GHVU01013130.1~~GHVU01013130.1.p1  ORF type:complete len:217 (+),score=36.22 GHVU01013130.1:66-653(+)
MAAKAAGLPHPVPFGGSWFNGRTEAWQVRDVEPWLPPTLCASSDAFQAIRPAKGRKTPKTVPFAHKNKNKSSHPSESKEESRRVGSDSELPFGESEASSHHRREFPQEWLDNFSRDALQQSQDRADEWAAEIVAAAKFSWRSYASEAMGADDFNTISGEPHNWIGAATMVYDSLSTLWLLGLHEDFFEVGGQPAS